MALARAKTIALARFHVVTSCGGSQVPSARHRVRRNETLVLEHGTACLLRGVSRYR